MQELDKMTTQQLRKYVRDNQLSNGKSVSRATKEELIAVISEDPVAIGDIGRDGLPICEADLEIIRKAPGKYKWFPRSPRDLWETLYKEGYACTAAQAQQVYYGLTKLGGIIMDGPPGTGKTFLWETLCRATGAAGVHFAGTMGVQEDSLVYIPLPDDTSKTGVSLYRGAIARAAEASWYGKVIILLDEWDKVPDRADDYLLTFKEKGFWEFGGKIVRCNTENILVLIGKNDKRTLYDALLRRFAAVEFHYMHPDSVQRILSETLGGNDQYIHLAVSVYTQTVIAAQKGYRITKPATLSELTSLVLAYREAAKLGDTESVHDALVFSLITKTREAHNALAEYLSREKVQDGDLEKAFEKSASVVFPREETWDPPQDVKRGGDLPVFRTPIEGHDENLEGATTVFVHTDASYDSVVAHLATPGPDAAVLGTVTVQKGGKLVGKKKWNIGRHSLALESLWAEGVVGEALVEEGGVPWQFLKSAQQDKKITITYYSRSRIEGNLRTLVSDGSVVPYDFIWELDGDEEETGTFKLVGSIQNIAGAACAIAGVSRPSDFLEKAQEYVGLTMNKDRTEEDLNE